MGSNRTRPGRSAWRFGDAGWPGPGAGTLFLPRERDFMGRGGDRLPRRLGRHDDLQPVGAHRWACAPRSGAAPRAAGRPTLDGSIQLRCRVGVLLRHDLVRLANRRYVVAAGRTQFDGAGVSDVGLLPRAAGWRGTDGGPVLDPVVSIFI